MSLSRSIYALNALSLRGSAGSSLAVFAHCYVN